MSTTSTDTDWKYAGKKPCDAAMRQAMATRGIPLNVDTYSRVKGGIRVTVCKSCKEGTPCCEY